MAAVTRAPARFDRLARVYRAMEYLSFGPMLERCRFAHIPRLMRARRALILGDGDGRFTARLLAANPQIRADCVDASSAMLRLLRERVRKAGAESRVTTSCGDARVFEPAAWDYDLVVTHFFLDCLTAGEAEDLVARVQQHLAPGALWLVSEFQTPQEGRVRAWASRSIIASLYAGFWLLTGLRVREIPPWRQLFARSGFARSASHTWLGGLLVSELWGWRETTAPQTCDSHMEVQPASIFAPAVGSSPGIDPDPKPMPDPPPVPEPKPAPGPPPEPDPEPYPGPLPMPQPVTRAGSTQAMAAAPQN